MHRDRQPDEILFFDGPIGADAPGGGEIEEYHEPLREGLAAAVGGTPAQGAVKIFDRSTASKSPVGATRRICIPSIQ
jgi:hypothetical protein